MAEQLFFQQSIRQKGFNKRINFYWINSAWRLCLKSGTIHLLFPLIKLPIFSSWCRLKFWIQWYSNTFNLLNIRMMLNKCIIQWFRFNVTIYSHAFYNEVFLFTLLPKNWENSQDYSLDRIKMTEWIWPKLVNMTKKLTKNVNFLNMTENIINITATTNNNGLICPKIVGESFGHVLILTFIGVKFFRSNSNQFLVILIQSSELASK